MVAKETKVAYRGGMATTQNDTDVPPALVGAGFIGTAIVSTQLALPVDGTAHVFIAAILGVIGTLGIIGGLLENSD